MSNLSVYIASTGQNVGKTTLSLGIFHGLQKRLGRVGFLKPVGQQHVTTESGYKADKDVVLFKEHFSLPADYATMSPVICDSGFTRDFLDQKIDHDSLLSRIQNAHKELAKTNDYLLIEGTGHVGVGSIFNLNNAAVASALNAPVVMIASGGLGAPIDELTLNIEMLAHFGVQVKGVILNRVQDEKRDMITTYFPKALKRWNIPLIGAIPFLPYLSLPTLQDFSNKLKAPFLSGEKYAMRHFRHSNLIATSLESFEQELSTNELLITPACREEIILATIEREKRAKKSNDMGLILTGSTPPRESLLKEIQKSDIPVLFTPISAYEVMQKISNFRAKIQKEDTKKIARAIDLVEAHVDFNQLID